MDGNGIGGAAEWTEWSSLGLWGVLWVHSGLEVGVSDWDGGDTTIQQSVKGTLVGLWDGVFVRFKAGGGCSVVLHCVLRARK